MRGKVEWVLVADAQHARILERRGVNTPWAERPDAPVAPPNPRAHDQLSDRAGRVHESVGGARHAHQLRHDPHRAGETAFAQQVADRLEAAATAGAYARLRLIAPPVFLGDLRKALGEATRKRLCGSLDKDLAEAPLADILGHLDDFRPA